MAIYYLYIFNKFGLLLYYKEWNRKKQSGITSCEEAKLMYGMIYSLKSFIMKVSSVDLKEGYFNYATNKYQLHVYETPTKLKLVMATDLFANGVQDLMRQIINQVYVEYMILSPIYSTNEQISSELFTSKLEELLKQHHTLAARVT